MPESVNVKINGRPFAVAPGCVVSAAIARAGSAASRRSVTGQPRAALCGMGICHECRIAINGVAHARGCLRLCEEGMEIDTGE